MSLSTFNDLPIRYKLLRMSLLSAGAALLLASLSFVVFDYATFQASLGDRLLAFADIIGYNSASAIVFNDVSSATHNLAALKARSGILAAAVYTPNGTRFTQWTHDNGNFQFPANPPPLADQRIFYANRVEVFHSIVVDNSRIGTVYIASDLSERSRRLERYLMIAMVVMVIAFVLAGLVSLEIGDRIARPILDLVKVARKVSVDKEYSLRAQFPASGEIGLLVATFNDMLAQIQQRGLALQRANDELEKKVVERTQALRSREEELSQSRRLESVGRLAGGMAHDFNNLLTGIIGCSEILEEDLPREAPYVVEVQEIKAAAERASSLTKQLLAFSRKQIISPQPMNLNTSIKNLEKLLRRLIGEDVELVITLDPKLGKIHADPVQVDQIIINLAVNSRDAMPTGGKLFIRTQMMRLDADTDVVDLQPGDYIMMTMTDTGMGMTPEVQAKIFEPFFTTKEQGKGTGLGLATVYGVVKQNHGGIQVYSHPNMGSTFKVFLPQLPENSNSSKSDPTDMIEDDLSHEESKAHETILIVEDEKLVSSHVARLLRRKGYQVITAYNGKEALELLGRHTGPLDMILSDIVMPDMNGRQLVDKIKETRPNLRVLYMSGYPAEIIGRHGVLEPGIEFIEKPFHSSDICLKIRQILDA